MALKGFLTSDSYTVVDYVGYDLKQRQIHFEYTTYLNSDKKIVLNKSGMTLIARYEMEVIEEYEEVEQTGEKRSPLRVKGEGHVVHDKVAGTKKVFNGQDWEEWNPLFWPDHASWDDYFGLENMDKPKSNILSRVYEYLKLRPDFAGSEDV